MALEFEGKKYVKVKKGGVTYNVINVRAVKNGVTYNVWGSGSSVTYVVDNGVAYSEDVLNGDSVLSPKTFTPAKSGYTFVGWRADKTASSSVLTSKTMGTEPITLYAVFKRTLTLSYNGNGSTSGSVDSQSGTQYYNNGNTANPSFTLANNGFSKTDYSFSKWAMGSADGTQYSAGASVTLTASTTFYAVWSALSIYVIQNGAITKSDYVQSANLSALEVGADNGEENGNSMTAFVLKNASRFSRVKIRFKYRTYADYGEHDVIVNGTEIGPDEYQYDWKEHSMYIDSTTCEVKVYARNDSSNDMWGAAAGFQLLDVYLEV